MSMFKTRNKKIYAGDSRITLDAKHQAMLSEFEKNPELIQQKVNQINKIKKQIEQKKKELSNNNGFPLIEESNELYRLEGTLREYEDELDNLRKNKNTQAYFLKTGDLLCSYYQHLDMVANDENPTLITQNPIDDNINKKRGRPSGPRGLKPKGKRNFSWMENTSSRGTNVLSFFTQLEKSNDDDDTTINSVAESSITNSTSNETTIDEDISKENEESYPLPNIDPGHDFDRATALQQYLQVVDPNYTPPNTPTWMVDFCPVCLQNDKVRRELLLQQSDGVLTCSVCGHMEQVVVDSEKPSYKDPPPEATYFAYKRINHFNEWLNQIQAKESTEIPPEVYQYILEEIKKERITDLATLTNEKVRSILKKLRLNKYYEHIPHIINKLNGLPPPILTREVEEKLRVMFREIQGPFLEVCPKDRKNFFSYPYTLHKCVELLGLNEYKSLFPLLKSREKLHRTDLLWSQICDKLGWTFHKSI